MKYEVEITHPKPDCYVNGTHEFDARPDQERWYVVAKHFGCSKSYRTAEIAIREMVREHAGEVHRITPAA